MPGDLESVFNTTDYFDTATMDLTSASPHKPTSAMSSAVPTAGIPTSHNMHSHNHNQAANIFGTSLGEPSAPFDRLETLSPNENLNAALAQYASATAATTAHTNGSSGMEGIMFSNGLGGDVLPSSGMDTDGSRSQQGL
jgi:hypothetical protein